MSVCTIQQSRRVEKCRPDVPQDLDLYTPFILNYAWPSASPVGPRRSLCEQLGDLGVGVEEIDTVLFR